MLKKILEDGVCPDEILNNISDEDKQLIFLEIRREQIRKYKVWQAYSESDLFRQSPNKKGNNVGFMEESRLVSFLGERPGDLSIDQILEQEALKKAQLEAERQIQNEFESVKETTPKETDDNTKIENLSEPQPVIVESFNDEPPISKPSPPCLPNKPITKRIPKTAEQKREEMVKRKSVELYQKFLTQISECNDNAEKENEEITKHWQIAEEHAKLEEEQRRKLAEEARKLHAHINNESTDNSNLTKTKPERPPLPMKKSDHLRLVINAIQKTNLSKSQHDIKSWFLENEWNKLKVFDGRTDVVPAWFHGMITREETEDLLDQQEPGTFLIRLSDKFQCYVLSYKTNSKIKHILIESKPESNIYMFVGPTNVRSFVSLADLIEFFKVKPLSSCSFDILRKPCGQKSGQVADYMHLLQPDSTNIKSSSVICSL